MRGFGVHRIVFILGMVLSSGCGGSGPGADGGIGGTGITPSESPSGMSAGEIEHAEGVTVNGVKFDTQKSRILVEGEQGSAGDISPGMLVSVFGEFDSDGVSGTAVEILVEKTLVGPIERVEPMLRAMFVMGQAVVVTPTTIFSGSTDLWDLQKRDVVEVSGFIGSNGSIQATRVDKTPVPLIPGITAVELEGYIKDFDPARKTFSIGEMEIDFGNPEVKFRGISEADLAEGFYVEVKGFFGTWGVLSASAIEPRKTLSQTGSILQAEIEGLVTALFSRSEFELQGEPVFITSQTLFTGGTAEDLALNARLEVEGRIDETGVLVADEIIFNHFRIAFEADVEEIDHDLQRFSLLGIPVEVNSLTQFSDQSEEARDPLTLNDIHKGDHLLVLGHLDNGVVIATSVTRRDPEEHVMIQGPVELLSDPEFVIFGVTIQTSPGTEFDGGYTDIETQDEFFDSVALGTLVRAEGFVFLNAFHADRVEIRGLGHP
ncbi:MAG TPA: DUF5666 domain-containing protein [Nitrospiria bacterium]